MKIEQNPTVLALKQRSGSACELCGSSAELSAFVVPPHTDESAETSILVCATCHEQIIDPEKTEANHWRCLNDSMWSTVAAVQVVAWRMLDRLRGEGWPLDLLEMLYLDEDTMAWAQNDGTENLEEAIVHKDAHGAVLQAGDSVVLTQSLDVKGTSFTAKRGTAVRNISLVHDNAGQIEGRVNGQKIIILTQYVKKSN